MRDGHERRAGRPAVAGAGEDDRAGDVGDRVGGVAGGIGEPLGVGVLAGGAGAVGRVLGDVDRDVGERVGEDERGALEVRRCLAAQIAVASTTAPVTA